MGSTQTSGSFQELHGFPRLQVRSMAGVGSIDCALSPKPSIIPIDFQKLLIPFGTSPCLPFCFALTGQK